jgi:hypothetical protein
MSEFDRINQSCSRKNALYGAMRRWASDAEGCAAGAVPSAEASAEGTPSAKV